MMINDPFLAGLLRGAAHWADGGRDHAGDVRRWTRPDGAEARPVRSTPRRRRSAGRRAPPSRSSTSMIDGPIERQLTTWPAAEAGAGPVRRVLRLAARRIGHRLRRRRRRAVAPTGARRAGRAADRHGHGSARRRLRRSPRTARSSPTSSIWRRCGCSRSTGQPADGWTTAVTTSAPTRRSTRRARLVTYQAWSVPDMPWDGAGAVTVPARRDRRWAWTRPADGAVQQPRYAPDGTPMVVHDGSGWLQVCWGTPAGGGRRGAVRARRARRGGRGRRRTPSRRTAGRVAFARNERGFGRLCVADVATGAVDEVARGVHGQLSWRGGRVAALRTGAQDADAGRRVRRRDLDARRSLAVGPVAGWDAVDLVEPEAITFEHDGTTLHARYYRSPAGGARRLLVMLHGGPTGQWPVTFMPRVAYWLGQGWDVLLPDHRGSTGHGRAYQQALHGRWGELDVVRHRGVHRPRPRRRVGRAGAARS